MTTSTDGALVPAAEGASPFVLPAADWANLKEWRGKLNILHTLQGSPVGRDEDGQRDYTTLLASWMTHEGPLPPPIASPERKKRREKQQAKKQQQHGGAVVLTGEGSSGDAHREQAIMRVGELACRMQELENAHGLMIMCNSEEYRMCNAEQLRLKQELLRVHA